MPWYEQVKAVAGVGDTIFNVMALTSPMASENPQNIHVADVVLLTKMYTSLFGDERLFFRHQRVKFDAKYWPKAWKKAHWAGELGARFSGEAREALRWNSPVPTGWPAEDNC